MPYSTKLAERVRTNLERIAGLTIDEKRDV